MEAQKEDKSDVNVPIQKLMELSGSETEEEMRLSISPSLNKEEETPSIVEDDLLRSSGGETEGRLNSPIMNETTEGAQRKARKKMKRNLNRRKRKQEEKQVKRAEKLMQGNSTQQRESNQAKLSEAGPATSKQEVQPESGRVSEEGTQVNQNLGKQSSSLKAFSKLRGPMAIRARRESKREAKNQSFELPTATASGESKSQEGCKNFQVFDPRLTGLKEVEVKRKLRPNGRENGQKRPRAPVYQRARRVLCLPFSEEDLAR